ncbi:hypothetical protein FRB94_010900 [Tulasnella sp. JGI-2019a]|nr:hypothetical protein FRB93_009727 [Tulasnella sp. JGI-2019a]KAG9010201.1 hypothetical protein FRB94_010900 [Tulasnella sp. JGI-2019a]
MSFTPAYRYITGQELADLIKSDKKPLEDFAIVDVRDDDFLGGNIVGCLRYPSEKYESSIAELIEKTKNVPKVIFHCALSQQRGPKAARIYAEQCAAQNEGAKTEKEVLVLRGGFTEFQSAFKNDPKLVEKWRKEVWGSAWY